MSQELIAKSQFIKDAKQIVAQGRQQAYQAVNSVMISTYWQLGKRIVEQEQSGNRSKDYGKYIVEKLSACLTNEFGIGFGTRNIWYYRQFYLAFPELEIWNARSKFRDSARARAESFVDSFPNIVTG